MIWNISQKTGLSIEDVLYNWSYENVLLFSSSTPNYDTDEKEDTNEGKWVEALDMNNPKNIKINPNSDNDDEEYIV